MYFLIYELYVIFFDKGLYQCFIGKLIYKYWYMKIQEMDILQVQKNEMIDSEN